MEIGTMIENQQNCSQMYLRSASEVKKLSIETNQMLNQARKKLLDEVIQDDDIYFINKQISIFDLVKHIFSKSSKY